MTEKELENYAKELIKKEVINCMEWYMWDVEENIIKVMKMYADKVKNLNMHIVSKPKGTVCRHCGKPIKIGYVCVDCKDYYSANEAN